MTILPSAHFLHGGEDLEVGVEHSDKIVDVLLLDGTNVAYEQMRAAAHGLANGVEYGNEAIFVFMKKYLFCRFLV